MFQQPILGGMGRLIRRPSLIAVAVSRAATASLVAACWLCTGSHGNATEVPAWSLNSELQSDCNACKFSNSIEQLQQDVMVLAKVDAHTYRQPAMVDGTVSGS